MYNYSGAIIINCYMLFAGFAALISGTWWWIHEILKDKALAKQLEREGIGDRKVAWRKVRWRRPSRYLFADLLALVFWPLAWNSIALFPVSGYPKDAVDDFYQQLHVMNIGAAITAALTLCIYWWQCSRVAREEKEEAKR